MTRQSLPGGWVKVQLSEVLDLRYGKGVPKKDRADVGVPYVASAGVCGFVARGLTTGRTIVIGRKGNVGSIHLIEGEVWPSDTTFYATVPECISERFIQYQLERLDLRSLEQSTAVPGLPREALEKVPLLLAPLAEQRRIVAELDRRFAHVDAAYTSIGRARARLIQSRSAIAESAISGRLLPNVSPVANLMRTGDIAEVRGGIQKQPKRRPVKNTRPFLRVANVGRGTLDLSEVHAIEVFGDEGETYRLHGGDLLVVEGNGSVGQIGRAATWDGSIPDCVHQNHLIRVRPGDSLDPAYLSIAWNSPSTIAQLRAISSSTSGLHTLSTAKVKQVQIPVPDLDTQRRVVREVDRQTSLVNAAQVALDASSARLVTLRRAILQAAFTGHLAPQDPADEAAAALLERLDHGSKGNPSHATPQPPRRRKKASP